jgi:DNA invertase Pin-like site-specific DNA recombinase
MPNFEVLRRQRAISRYARHNPCPAIQSVRSKRPPITIGDGSSMSDVESFSEQLVRAAQYVRMSTENQRFSIDNQKTVIAEYARARGYDIVRTYADPGKSGLSLKGRHALRRLLADALNPDRDFEAILVLDVSRWGRFQDPDQAAYCEFICRQAGVKVAYCAEPFENDITPMTSIMKHLKRVMASEFSRDLSAKLSRAHLHQAKLGFRQGGGLIYGFRRQLIDESGKPRFLLEPGQHKALRNDRVRYALGTAAEQGVIRAIFHLYVRQEYSLVEIVHYLRSAEIPGNDGRPWSTGMVRSVLSSELCVRRYIYNRTNRKLQMPTRRNPEHLWVRAPAKIDSLISEDLFAEAQARLIRRKPTKFMRETMLEGLRALLKAKGRLSLAIIDRAPNLPGTSTYKNHFGSVSEALRQIGYVKPFCSSGAECAWTTDELRTSLKRLYDQEGYLSNSLINKEPELPSIITIRRKVGSMAKIYEFIGMPPKTHGEILREVMARRAEKMRGSPLLLRPGRQHWNQEAMIERLKHLLAQHGYLSAPLIEADPLLPSVTTIIKRFGSVLKAYQSTGWAVDRGKLAALRGARKHR